MVFVSKDRGGKSSFEEGEIAVARCGVGEDRYEKSLAKRDLCRYGYKRCKKELRIKSGGGDFIRK